MNIMNISSYVYLFYHWCEKIQISCNFFEVLLSFLVCHQNWKKTWKVSYKSLWNRNFDVKKMIMMKFQLNKNKPNYYLLIVHYFKAMSRYILKMKKNHLILHYLWSLLIMTKKAFESWSKIEAIKQYCMFYLI